MNSLSINTFEMVIADFQEIDKLVKVQFFQEKFLLAQTNIEIVFGISFLISINIDI